MDYKKNRGQKMKYKGVDIFNIDDFDKAIYVNNKEFRTENTKNYFEQSMIINTIRNCQLFTLCMAS